MKNFFLVWTPLPVAGVPGPNSRYPWSPPWPRAIEGSAVFTLVRVFSGT